jgi:hypothetical protein
VRMVESAIQHKILLAAAARHGGADPRVFRRAAQRGELVRLSRGAYVRTADWAEMDDVSKYISRVIATALSSRTQPTVSHASAAVLWGLPRLGPLPQFVHVLSSPSTGTRNEGGVRRHSTVSESIGIDEVEGVALTGFARTVIEYSHTVPLANAVIALDWALQPSTPARPKPAATREQLRQMIEDLSIVRGKRELLRALAFADPRSGSPGESLSRVNMALAGLPAPDLQAEFSDAQGRIGFVDFWWPGANLIGEFDGAAKYVRDEFTNGRQPGDVVLAEKVREDRLRATVRRPRVSRWGWKTANSVDVLREHLVAAGLPVDRRIALPYVDVRARQPHGFRS